MTTGVYLSLLVKEKRSMKRGKRRGVRKQWHQKPSPGHPGSIVQYILHATRWQYRFKRWVVLFTNYAKEVTSRLIL